MAIGEKIREHWFSPRGQVRMVRSENVVQLLGWKPSGSGRTYSCSLPEMSGNKLSQPAVWREGPQVSADFENTASR